MIIKSPSKRVSQLDLKFLDLKFMSINQSYHSRTDPLPRLNQSSIDPSKISRFQLSSKNQSSQQLSPCDQDRYLKLNKKSVFKADQNTRDITNQNCAESILGQNSDLSTQRVLNYLSADTDAIYKQFGSRFPNCNKSQKKKQTNISKPIHQYSKQDSMDRQLLKYQEQVKNYQKQNQLIHHQITRLYSDKKSNYLDSLEDKNFQVKNVRNMRIFQQNHHNSIQDKNEVQNYYAEVTESYRYQSQDKQINKLKKGFFDKFKSTSQKYEEELKNEKNGQKNIKQSKQHKHTFSQCKSLRSNSNDCQFVTNTRKINTKASPNKLLKDRRDKLSSEETKFPRLIQFKYDKFYQDLYKGKKDKILLTEKQRQLINQENQSIQTLEQLKKKMINNNFDKNFEAFLQQKKIRVPQFIKNLR